MKILDGIGGPLPVGEVPTNCAFSGSTLYVTDGGTTGETSDATYSGRLWAVELDGIEGMELFYGAVPAG